MTKQNDILSVFDTEASSEAGSWLHLSIPGTDGEPAYADKEREKPLRIKLKGPDSDTWTSYQRKAMKSQGKKDTRTAKEIAREDAQLMARMTLDIENIPGYAGSEFNSLVDLYLKYKDIRMQALMYVINRENFTQKLPND
jgi:hypothetical protein